MRIEIEVMTDNLPYEELFDVMLAAFEERRQQGLNFQCLGFNLDDFIDEESGKSVSIARDCDMNDKVVGFQNVWVEDDHAVSGLIAIHPNYKRKGIGSMLFQKTQEFAKKNGISFLTAGTAVDAKSSVKWHLRNGFRIVELASWPNTNYYSYNFRKQLVYDAKWSNPLFCKIHYWLSALKCKLMYLPDGKYRFPGVMNMIAKVYGLVFK